MPKVKVSISIEWPDNKISAENEVDTELGPVLHTNLGKALATAVAAVRAKRSSEVAASMISQLACNNEQMLLDGHEDGPVMDLLKAAMQCEEFWFQHDLDEAERDGEEEGE